MAQAPTLPEVMEEVFASQLGELNAIGVGIVDTWYRTVSRADIRSAVRSEDGSQPAILPFVPVMFPGVYWDIQEGQAGIILYGDFDWHGWFRTGEATVPDSEARHDRANAIFLPGLNDGLTGRDMGSDSTTVAIPAAGGDVLLGGHTANKKIVHEDLLGQLSSVMNAMNTWGATSHLDWAAASTAWTADVAGSIASLVVAIAAGAYEAQHVKVDPT